jgi:hypothetical protein
MRPLGRSAGKDRPCAAGCERHVAIARCPSQVAAKQSQRHPGLGSTRGKHARRAALFDWATRMHAGSLCTNRTGALSPQVLSPVQPVRLARRRRVGGTRRSLEHASRWQRGSGNRSLDFFGRSRRRSDFLVDQSLRRLTDLAGPPHLYLCNLSMNVETG